LKSPVHTGHLSEYLRAIPNARIVCIHRNAVDVQGSANSLFRTLFSVVSDHVDVAKMARTNLDLLTIAADRALQARSEIGRNAVLDIRYQDLLEHPVQCVEKIYAHHQLAFTDDFRAALNHFISARPQHHFGIHRYSLDEFGLDENDVKQRFGRYDQLA